MLIIEEGWTKTTLNQAQKEDILFGGGVLDSFYDKWYDEGKTDEEIKAAENELLSKTWYIIDDEEDRDDYYWYPDSLYIDGEWVDYLSRWYSDKLIKLGYETSESD